MALTKVPSNLDAAVSITQSQSDNSTNVATTAYVDLAISNLSDSAPAALNTLNEIAAALGDDANYASTTTAAIAAKLPLSGGTMTGNLTGTQAFFSPNTAGKNTITITTNASDDGRILIKSDTTDKVDIQANGNTYFNGGNVGIGTSPPRAKLDVTQTTNRTSKTGATRGVLHLQDGDTPANNELTAITFESNSNNAASIIGQSLTNSGSSLFFGTSNNYSAGVTNTAMSINHYGNVGIGTSLPDERLHVQGDGADILLTDAGNGQMAKLGSTGSNNGLLEINNSAHASKVLLQASGNSYINGGNVGIGDNSPVAKLSIKGANDTNFEIQPDISSGVNRITNFNRVTSAYKVLRVDASEQQFYISGNPMLKIFSNVVASEIDVAIKNGKKIEFQTTSGIARGYISAQETNTGGTHSAGLIIATSGGEQITFKDSGIGGNTNLTIKNGELLVPATTTHQSVTPHSYIYGGNTGTYNKTVTYLHQNNTSNNAINGMFIELGRLTDSSTAEIRHFVVGARGGQQLLKVDGLGNLKPTGKIEVGTFPQSQSNTGEAWIGRAADRQDGCLTVQLGGNDATGTRFEIVDRAWSKVIAQISGEAPSDSLWVSSNGNTQFGYHVYNSSSGISMIGPTGRTFWDMNYNSYGAEILLVNNRTASGAASVLQYRTNSVVEGTLQGSSTGLAISNVSDYRKKENIRDLTGSLSVIKSLQPRVYEYREGFGSEGDHIGFIAHEIQAHIPKAVTGDKDDLYTQADIDEGGTGVVIGDPKYQAVSYTHNEIITRLVQSIQELEARIAVLEG